MHSKFSSFIKFLTNHCLLLWRLFQIRIFRADSLNDTAYLTKLFCKRYMLSFYQYSRLVHTDKFGVSSLFSSLYWCTQDRKNSPVIIVVCANCHPLQERDVSLGLGTSHYVQSAPAMGLSRWSATELGWSATSAPSQFWWQSPSTSGFWGQPPTSKFRS